MTGDHHLNKPGAEPASDRTVRYDPFDIAIHRALHSGSRCLSRVMPSARTQGWERNARYRRALAEFGRAESDIWVATYSKSGTTWMQFILYQLKTAGGMDFDHLFDVSPWVYYAAMRNVKPARTTCPRILKTHDPYRHFAAGSPGRFVVVLRDGKDVAVSWYHHRRNFRGYQGSFSEHFEEFLFGEDYNWFFHVRDWLENASSLPTLTVKYEDLQGRFDAEVRRVAAFCSLPLDDEVMARVRERCTFSFMKQHEWRLGPRTDHFPPGSTAPFAIKATDQFLRKGVVGEGLTVLTSAQLDAYRRRFDEILGAHAMIADYR